MEQTPDGEASAKLAQHLAVAVQVAEAVIRLRQQRADAMTTGSQQAAAAARAERTAQHAADRLVWTPAFERDWLAKATLHDLGRAWGAATGWADTDPAADAAARRVEAQLSEIAPNAMARFDELRETGWTRVDAMGDVLAGVATESHASRRVFVADGAPTAADASARAESAGFEARQSERTPDDPSTPRVDEHAEGVRAAAPTREEQAALLADADAEAALARYRVTDAGTPHPADVAAESYPRPFGDVQPQTTRALPAAAAAGKTAARTRALTR